MAGELAVTAVSFHAYARLADRYLLLPHGASFGDGYGPVVVARAPDRRGSGSRRGRSPWRRRGSGRRRALALRLWAPGVRDALHAASTRSRRRCARASRSGPADPRGAADVRRGGLDGGRRPRPLVEGGDGPAAAARRQRRAPGPRARAHRPHLARALPLDRVRPGPPRARPSTTPCATRAASTARRPTSFVGMYVNAWTRGYGEAGPAGRPAAARPGARGGPDSRRSRPSTRREP